MENESGLNGAGWASIEIEHVNSARGDDMIIRCGDYMT